MKQFVRDFASELIYVPAAFLFVAAVVWLLRNAGLAWYEWPMFIGVFAFMGFILWCSLVSYLGMLVFVGNLASAILGDRGGRCRDRERPPCRPMRPSLPDCGLQG